MTAPLRIGELARQAGVSIDAIRFYEREGLLPRAARSAAGYRRFEPTAARRLRFIRRAQALGFTLEEVGALLELRVRGGRSCVAVRARAAERLQLVERKLADLERIRAALVELVASCDRAERDTPCPLLAALGAEEDDGRAS